MGRMESGVWVLGRGWDVRAQHCPASCEGREGEGVEKKEDEITKNVKASRSTGAHVSPPERAGAESTTVLPHPDLDPPHSTGRRGARARGGYSAGWAGTGRARSFFCRGRWGRAGHSLHPPSTSYPRLRLPLLRPPLLRLPASSTPREGLRRRAWYLRVHGWV
jgi:hypothetical protein